MIEPVAPLVESASLALQSPGPGVSPGPEPIRTLFGGAIGAFLTTLVVGGLLVVFAPDYVERTIPTVVDDPLGSFLYGVVALVVLAVATVVLVFTIVGILVAIPLLLIAYVTWIVGAALAFLAIGHRLVGRADGWAKPLVVGAAVNGVLTLTGIGGIVVFAVGTVGFGTVLRGGRAES